jgi:hypothetical protein
MTPYCLRKGVSFTKTKYEIHTSNPIFRPTQNEFNHSNISNQNHSPKRSTAQNLIQTTPYNIDGQPTSITRAEQPHPGSEIAIFSRKNGPTIPGNKMSAMYSTQWLSPQCPICVTILVENLQEFLSKIG